MKRKGILVVILLIATLIFLEYAKDYALAQVCNDLSELVAFYRVGVEPLGFGKSQSASTPPPESETKSENGEGRIVVHNGTNTVITLFESVTVISSPSGTEAVLQTIHPISAELLQEITKLVWDLRDKWNSSRDAIVSLLSALLLPLESKVRVVEANPTKTANCAGDVVSVTTFLQYPQIVKL